MHWEMPADQRVQHRAPGIDQRHGKSEFIVETE